MDITAQDVAYTYLFPVICTAGITGNLMLLITLKLSSLRESPYIYLATLAVADLVALISVAGICVVRCENCGSSVDLQYVGKMYENFAYLPISNMAAYLVSFTTLMMTIERFIYVRHPVMSLNIITTGKTKFIVTALALVAIGVNVPRFFLYDVRFVYGPDPTRSSQSKNGTIIPAYLTLNCIPPTCYSKDCQLECNVSVPAAIDGGEAAKNSTLNGDRCLINVAKLADDKDALKMDSIFNYESGLERVSYNLTDGREIEKLLYNFPCDFNENYPHYKSYLESRVKLNVTVNNTSFYDAMGEKYFASLSGLYMLPYVGVAILNCYIIAIVRKSATRRRHKLMERTYSFKTTAKLAEQDHLTITLLCLTGIQILANLVYLSSVKPVARMIYKDDDLRENASYNVHIIASNMCILIQYSSNFLFFAFFNGRFRREFNKVLVLRISNKFKNVASTLRRRKEPEVPTGNSQARMSTSTVVSLCAD